MWRYMHLCVTLLVTASLEFSVSVRMDGRLTTHCVHNDVMSTATVHMSITCGVVMDAILDVEGM